MFSWIRLQKRAVEPAPSLSVKEVEMNRRQIDPEVYASELAAGRKAVNTQLWMARVQESMNLHLLLEFPELDLGNAILNQVYELEKVKSTLVPIKLLEPTKKYPGGNWERQKLVIRFHDQRPVIAGYSPIVSDLGVGLVPTALSGSIGTTDIMAFTYDNDQLRTPRLDRRHQLRLVKDLVELGQNLNQQLKMTGFLATRINLERRSYHSHPVPTGHHSLRISSYEEIKYSVAIPAPAPVLF
jgi:hypothetical protein